VFQNLKIKIARLFLRFLSRFNTPMVWAIKQAIIEIERLETIVKPLQEEIKKLTDDIARLDRTAALDVRSSLELLNFESMGELIWIRVSDDRMLRHDVFNQIRDWMSSHGKGHSVLVVTGTNVTFNTMTEEDLTNARLRRMTQEERERNLLS
jgi:hypothetical protein